MIIENFSSYLDFANHKSNSTEKDIEFLCNGTIKYKFNSSFLNPFYINFAKKILNNKSKVGSVISFPLGQDFLNIKILSIKECLAVQVDELDVVLNIGLIKEHQWQKSFDEMEKLVKTVKDFDNKKIIKFIPETGYLTPDEIKKTAELIVKSGADFFKTCSGFGPRGATIEDVHLIRKAIGNSIKIKVAGGISTYKKALEFINAGANRIGTSSAIEIIEEYNLIKK